MRANTPNYRNLDELTPDRDLVPWYWRLIAFAASWMILGGYLILPALYDDNPKLRFSKTVISVLVVVLLTAGYSFTALLCFACRNEMFQAEAIFLPSLASSALGLLTILYNFVSSTRYTWNTAAIIATVLSSISTVTYGLLLIWTHRRILKIRESNNSRSQNMWSDPSFYSNFIQNMYPSARAPSDRPPLSEDDLVNQQMAMLLMKSDSGPSPDASQSTFRIDLPEDREERERLANSAELLATPTLSHHNNRGRSLSVNNSPNPGYDRGAWERRMEDGRGRSDIRPTPSQVSGGHSRAVSREERRREIELGAYPSQRSNGS
ncbi:hypothetical protein BU16DRAFT_538096 [Lophium mytilinum]|uniref:Uncharacterized protein n=1 Tax=Lophium mytilinum TaxID=390894 RepID=A0A6A6QX21_9PEZI|nr:hypothetical protein BU16DRAFT_538096 [Lophium mytilinum]